MAVYEQFDKTAEEIRKSLKDGYMPITKMAKDSQKADGEMTPAAQQKGDAKVDKPKETTVPGDTLEVSKAKDKPNDAGEIKKPKADEKSEKEMSPAEQQQGDGKVEKAKEAK